MPFVFLTCHPWIKQFFPAPGQKFNLDRQSTRLRSLALFLYDIIKLKLCQDDIFFFLLCVTDHVKVALEYIASFF